MSRRMTKPTKMTCAPSEDSDQPGHPPGVIRVFAVRMMPTLLWVFAGRTCHFVGFVMHRLKINLPYDFFYLFFPCLNSNYFEHFIIVFRTHTPTKNGWVYRGVLWIRWIHSTHLRSLHSRWSGNWGKSFLHSLHAVYLPVMLQVTFTCKRI